VSDVADRFWNNLPDEGDDETPDTRDAEMKMFKFAAYPLRRFSVSAVVTAEKSLQSKLNDNFASIMKVHWQRKREALEQEFRESLLELQGRYGVAPCEELRQAAEEAAEDVKAEFAEMVDQVGGLRAGWQKRYLRKSVESLMPCLPEPAVDAPEVQTHSPEYPPPGYSPYGYPPAYGSYPPTAYGSYPPGYPAYPAYGYPGYPAYYGPAATSAPPSQAPQPY